MKTSLRGQLARLQALVLCVALGCGSGDDGGTGPTQTIHTSAITTNQAWTREGSPHIVRGTVMVQFATLTIDAGATVEFEAAARIVFSLNGRLEVLGTAAQPVTMRGAQQGRGTWIGLRFRTNLASVLRYVTLSGCGGADPATLDSVPPACVALGNELKRDDTPTITIDHVTVEEALNGGIALYGQSHFGNGSTTLSVRTSGYAARIPLYDAKRFPLGGTFTSLDTNEVRISSGNLGESLTLASGIPWATEGDIFVEGTEAPILTIEPGTTMRLRGSFVAGQSYPGGIKIGAEGGPPVNLVPSLERWGGIVFQDKTILSSLSNVVLETCGAQITSCLSLIGDPSTGLGPSVPLKNVTIRNGMGGGLGMILGGRPAPGSTNLTITGTIQRSGAFGDGEGWPIGLSDSPVSAIPSGHYTGNHHDMIAITQATVRQSETWVKHDVPYFVIATISVGDASNPVLTLEPGVTVLGSGGTWIYVGDPEHGPGSIRAIGTAALPITFRGLSEGPGAWGGISIMSQAIASTLFDHVIVENGGGAHPLFANFLFYVDLGPVIRNSVVRNSAGCGVIITGNPPWTTDFKAPGLGNTFQNNAEGDICGP